MSAKNLQQLRSKLEKHLAVIAKERDAMRELQDEVESVLEPTDRGIEALEEAISAISEQV